MPTSQRFFQTCVQAVIIFFTLRYSLRQQYRRTRWSRTSSFDARVSSFRYDFLSGQPSASVSPRHLQALGIGSGGCSGSALVFACVFALVTARSAAICSRRGQFSGVGLCRGLRRCAGWNSGFRYGLYACGRYAGRCSAQRSIVARRRHSACSGPLRQRAFASHQPANLCGLPVFTCRPSLGFGVRRLLLLAQLGRQAAA